jgi:hypothetical protein
VPVTAAANLAKPAGWLFAYFRQIYSGEVLAESLHYALSRDGLQWTPLNGNQGIWTPIIDGEMHNIRDPFVSRALDGRYHMVGTHARQGWSHVDLLHAASDDLIHWEDVRLLDVLAGVLDAKNAWAPEFVPDAARGEHLLVWSTSTGPKLWWDKCIWACRTRDFREFSPARVLFDPKLNIIDANIASHGGKHFMYFKPDSVDAEKYVRIAVADDLDGPWEIATENVTPAITEGPQVVRRDDLGGWLMYYDYPWENRYGVSFSPDLLSWEIVPDVSFPTDARHGSIVELSQEQFAAIEVAFPA